MIRSLEERVTVLTGPCCVGVFWTVSTTQGLLVGAFCSLPCSLINEPPCIHGNQSDPIAVLLRHKPQEPLYIALHCEALQRPVSL